MAQKRPPTIHIDPYSVRVIRGPREDGRWYWRARKFQGGTEETAWTGWGTPQEARETVAGLVVGKAPKGPDTASTIKDLLEFWLGAQEERADLSPLSVQARRYHARHLAEVVGAVRLEAVSRATLERHASQRSRQGAAPRTIALELSALQSAWIWGREVGLHEGRDLPGLRLKIQRRRDTPAPDGATLREAVDHLSGWKRLAILLLEGTGCRMGEIAGLTWDRVCLEPGRESITVVGKTGRREVPISGQLALELESARHPGPRVLPVARGSVGPQLHRALGRLEGPKIAPQGIRRAAVGALYRGGADVGTAASILGHSPTTALKYYREVSEGDRRAAMLQAGMGRLGTEGEKVIAFPRRRK